MPQNKSTKFMDSVIFTLYNYASNQREEYLLLRLFKTALQEEIKYGTFLQTTALLHHGGSELKIQALSQEQSVASVSGDEKE
jgi:hypothetical protein